MTASSISIEGGVFYTYRGKGGKTGERELPRPASDAIQLWWECVGKDVATMESGESLWPDTREGRGITSGAFTNLRRDLKSTGLPPAGVHTLGIRPRSSGATQARSVEEVSRFLDHSSLAVTTYLRRLEGQEDRPGKGWPRRSGSNLRLT